MASKATENTDLLRSQANARNVEENVPAAGAQEPPDGGLRAYLVVLASFMSNGLIFGVINNVGSISSELNAYFKKNGKHNMETVDAAVGTLAMASTFLMSPVSAGLAQRFGLRITAIAGGTIAVASLFISSFFAHNPPVLCFTFGIMFGTGASLAYTPSLAILGHYFKKYLGIVNGIVTIGSSLLTVVFNAILGHTIPKYGLSWTFVILAVITIGLPLCGPAYKPLNVSGDSKKISKLDLWHNKKYRLWVISMPIALFGYFVPYVHIKELVKSNFSDSDSNLPVKCIAIMSGIGRLLFGFLGDMPLFNEIYLQQLSFYVIGVMAIIVPWVNLYWLVVLISLTIGLFEGGFIALIGPIAIRLCGPAMAEPAIGCMLGLAAVPIATGPILAAAIKEATNSYYLPFGLAGLSPIIGATLMFTITCLFRDKAKPRSQNAANGVILDNVEKHQVQLIVNGEANKESKL